MKNAAKSPGNIVALVSLAFMLALISFSVISLDEQHVAWAAEAHIARPSSATLRHAASMPSSTKTFLVPHADTPNPTIINGQWYCQPPYMPVSRQISRNTRGIVDFSVNCVKKDLSFPCSDIRGHRGKLEPDEALITRDWLSGDVFNHYRARITGDALNHYTGHIIYTYPEDTYALPEIFILFGYMQALAFFMLIPSMVLLGYNFLFGASTFRYAGSLEGLSRVLLGGMAVAVSFTLVQMLINLETLMAIGISQLHAQFPYPRTIINGIPIPYTLATEPAKRFPASYRGLVVPMSRWGCAANDFIGIFSPQFITDTLATIIPMIGDFAHLAGKATTVTDLTSRVGEMTMTVLSILLWAQVFVRIIVLNYYILTAPLSFGCWAMPGGIGQRVVGLWFKGFFSVLFVQVVQLFILTTLPLILPALPQIPSDSVGVMQGFLVEFPPILTLCVTLMAPTLIGASASKVLGTAGSMAGQTVIVLGTVASQAG
jgi:hypothetical protein